LTRALSKSFGTSCSEGVADHEDYARRWALTFSQEEGGSCPPPQKAYAVEPVQKTPDGLVMPPLAAKRLGLDDVGGQMPTANAAVDPVRDGKPAGTMRKR
jgi:hypothetical protein